MKLGSQYNVGSLLWSSSTSCHMASMPINDRRLIKLVMLICFSSAKFLLQGVNVVSFSNDHSIVSSHLVSKTPVRRRL